MFFQKANNIRIKCWKNGYKKVYQYVQYYEQEERELYQITSARHNYYFLISINISSSQACNSSSRNIFIRFFASGKMAQVYNKLNQLDKEKQNCQIEKNISQYEFRCPKQVFFQKKINNLLAKANDSSDKFKDLAKFDEETFNKLVRDKFQIQMEGHFLSRTTKKLQ